jgi:hypothetical protein
MTYIASNNLTQKQAQYLLLSNRILIRLIVLQSLLRLSISPYLNYL